MPDSILQNETVAELREFSVRLVTGLGAPALGQSPGSGLVIKIAKPGGNFAAFAGSIAEVTGGAEGGGYRVRLHSSEVDTIGDLHFEITHAGQIQGVYGSIPIRPALRTAEVADGYLTAAKLAGDVTTTLQAGLATSVQINRLLFLMHENSMIDTVIYGAQGIITSARIRGFASQAALTAATAGAADNADGEIFRATITAADIGAGQFSSYKIARSL